MTVRLTTLLLLVCFFSSCNDDESTTPVDVLEGCCQTTAIEATVGNGKVFVANIFTPNADGFNDILLPFANEEIEMINLFEISDGNEVFFTAENFAPNNSSFGWAGTQGQLVAKGVLNVKVIATSTDGTTETLTGEVCSLPCQNGDDPDELFDLTGCRFSTQHNGAGGVDISLPTFEELPCLE